MPWPKGRKRSEQDRQSMHEGQVRNKRPKTAEHIKKIGDALRGIKHSRKHAKTCPNCDKEFMSASGFARFCSRECKRACKGHGIVHARAYSVFPKQCAICGSVKALVGDHNHVTGKPRGILCRHCNLTLGAMKENPARLREAANYLEKRNPTYLSGPMSGIEANNFPLFSSVCKGLRERGYNIVSPHELTSPVEEPSWTDYMRRDLIAMMDCDAIIMMDGWKDSKGASLEHKLATELGYRIMYLADF
jgi:hypothetical protein